MAVHEVAQKGFNLQPDAYENARPTFPAAATEYLVKQVPLLPGMTAVEIGSGTGKFTRSLVPLKLNLSCVEPAEEVRANHLQSEYVLLVIARLLMGVSRSRVKPFCADASEILVASGVC